MKKILILTLLTFILSGCSISNQTSKESSTPVPSNNNGVSQKPPELYETKDECIPHAKQGYCLQSNCTKGESNGSKHYDGSTDICEESWGGWIPVNKVIPN